jgi:hypothetical protein
MFRTTGKSLGVVVVLLVAITFAGCSKVSKENYDKLKLGMAYEQVVEILGKPDSCSEKLGTKTCRWGGEQKYISVAFIASKAVAFSRKGLE